MKNKKSVHEKSWVLLYENGFVTKTVDYLPTITDENQIVSKKQYRYQVWTHTFGNGGWCGLFFDSFQDKDKDGQFHINKIEADFNLDPDSRQNKNYLNYQHEIGIHWLLESMNISLGDQTHDIDGFPVGENEPI